MCASSARTNHLSSLTVKIQIHIAIAFYYVLTNQSVLDTFVSMHY